MPTRVFLCHDCCAVLSREDRGHYVYQCHACVMVEHERMRLVDADPLHPDSEHLERSAVPLGRTPPKIDLRRRVA